MTMGPWQTQDTAPRDGSWFLLLPVKYTYDENLNWVPTGAVFEIPDIVHWDEQFQLWISQDGDYDTSIHPTFYWLPFPPYPLPTERERLACEMGAEVQLVKDRIMYGS